MKRLILLRGLPGSGKSTLGGFFDPFVLSADDYFEIYCKGKFNPDHLQDAHAWCQEIVSNRMEANWNLITVANTFTQEWEMKPYLDLAKENDYTVCTVIVENRHGSSSIHNVPETTIEKMRKRFSIKL